MNGIAMLATGTTGTTTMTEAVTSLMSTATTVLSTVTQNEVLMTFFCAGIVFIGIGIVKRLK